MEINIEYTYRTFKEIQGMVEKFNNFSIIQFSILIIIFIVIICIILYIMPAIDVYLKISKKAKESENKKLALKQILIQKEIEEGVQKEIENENLNTL